ncbi:beta-propeller domain-containing protein [Halapricum salinum]|uniref:Secreted protein containing C-terminal beta-propeller domain n=1 Tax=Halapricum salinum TaxID=1457250 RepID=A0A4D6HFI0_9EURY|nr:beta-propeller domain-containing protein [Halapricum salinum]QCC52824.1 hypothetical protein DV733_16980 [Halapricum salinum]
MRDVKLGAIVAVALLVGSAVGAGVATVGLSDDGAKTNSVDGPTTSDDGPSDGPDMAERGVETFDSASDFQSYVRNGQQSRSGGLWGTIGPRVDLAVETTTFQADAARVSESGGSDTVDRHSSTNVQEQGIDEPDRLKTTGELMYYADRPIYRVQPFLERRDDADRRWQPPGSTHIIDSSEPAAPQQIAGINQSGNLLLSNDSLVVFQGSRLVGYDVSDAENPERIWTRTINGSVETARLVDGRIYLVTSSSVSAGSPCPVVPLSGPGGRIDCTSIYHPRQQIPVDVTYTAYTLDPSDGAVQDSVSVVGTQDRSAIYMSDNALYITYTQRTPRGELLGDAILSAQIDAPDWVENRVREVRSYNLSARATQIEIEAAINQWLQGVPEDEREQLRDDYQKGLESYVQNHRRTLTTTGIARIGVGDGLSVEATGQVPGEPLNQFSMDEHNGSLRIATTIPRQFGTKSVNDLYTLEADSLDRQGSVQGMGVDQRVYSVRYVGDTAYVVTFRQIDPFHVIDLSDPSDPEELGELELPGYSSYLHPIDEDHVLGIGEEDGRVKATLFDVTDKSTPTIDDTYYPGAGWSSIAESHHAFLIDRKHEVFFLPGNDHGYVVDYTDSELTEQTQVEIGGQPQRAAYVDDYLYVFSDRELVVMDETDWSRETSLDLDSE